MPMSFNMSQNVEHSSEKNAKGAHAQVYKFYTPVVTAHFFFSHCIVIKVRLETNC